MVVKSLFVRGIALVVLLFLVGFAATLFLQGSIGRFASTDLNLLKRRSVLLSAVEPQDTRVRSPGAKAKLPGPSAPMIAEAVSPTASSSNLETIPHAQTQITQDTRTSVLQLHQGGYISRRFLGCWHGTTAPRPLERRPLSDLAALVFYQDDDIDVCMTWNEEQLLVKNASASSVFYAYRYDYRVLQARGTEITLEINSSDPAYPNTFLTTGQEFLVLNSNDTVDCHIQVVSFVRGKAAVWTKTAAVLRRRD
jgi:hypothetical protein